MTDLVRSLSPNVKSSTRWKVKKKILRRIGQRLPRMDWVKRRLHGQVIFLLTFQLVEGVWFLVEIEQGDRTWNER